MIGTFILRYGADGVQPACGRGARLLRAAVGRAFADGGLVPFELGGDAGTEAITRRILECVRSQETPEVEASEGSR